MTDLTDEAVKALVAHFPRPQQHRSGEPLLNMVYADPGNSGFYYREEKPDSVTCYVRIDHVARALLADRAELDRLRAETDAFRMCVNCGRVVPASHDRAEPGPGCKAPDACTFDLTPREAWEHWRAKAHQYRADTEAAVALALEAAARLLDNRVEQLVADYGSYESDANVTNLPEWVETAEEELEPLAAAIRALVPASALAKLAKLRTERDEWKAVSETLSEMQAGEYKRAEALAAENAELRAAIAAKDAEISVSRQLWEKQDAAKDAERDRLAADVARLRDRDRRRLFPILKGEGAKIDYQLVADHAEQARSNHYQSVDRLAQRGGLSWCELYAILHNRKWERIDTNEAMIACRALEARYLAALATDAEKAGACDGM